MPRKATFSSAGYSLAATGSYHQITSFSEPITTGFFQSQTTARCPLLNFRYCGVVAALKAVNYCPSTCASVAPVAAKAIECPPQSMTPRLRIPVRLW